MCVCVCVCARVFSLSLTPPRWATQVRVKKSVFEDTGYNGGDSAHAWNEAVLAIEVCAFRFGCYGVGIDDGAFVSVSRSLLHDLHFEAFYCGKNSEHAEIGTYNRALYRYILGSFTGIMWALFVGLRSRCPLSRSMWHVMMTGMIRKEEAARVTRRVSARGDRRACGREVER